MSTGKLAAKQEIVRSLDWHVGQITESWRSSVEGIFETGRRVQTALEQLPHGEKSTLWDRLPFSQKTGGKLVVIANGSDRLYSYTSNLPPAWSTIYELTQLNDEQLPRFMESGEPVEQKIIRAFRKRDSQHGRIEQFTDAGDLPTNKYQVIYADPPWQYEHAISDSRKIENQYPTMGIDDICELPVSSMAADDAVLFMWVTSPMLEKGFAVLEAWGFEYRTCMVWVKPQLGMGYYVRQQHELMLIGRRGNPPVPNPENKPSSVLNAPRTKHSAKPPEFYGLIESMYPNAKRIELFCREPQPKWDAWGNQVAA